MWMKDAWPQSRCLLPLLGYPGPDWQLKCWLCGLIPCSKALALHSQENVLPLRGAVTIQGEMAAQPGVTATRIAWKEAGSPQGLGCSRKRPKEFSVSKATILFCGSNRCLGNAE